MERSQTPESAAVLGSNNGGIWSRILLSCLLYTSAERLQKFYCEDQKDNWDGVFLIDGTPLDEKLIDKKLEADMDEVLKVVVLGRASVSYTHLDVYKRQGYIHG